jgi:hypothetical protein
MTQTSRRTPPTARPPAEVAPAEHERPPYRWAAVASGALFALYAITLAPTTAFWDTSEYIATAHIMGVPHPPGNPAFVLLARAWELLLSPLGLPTAVRINLFSAAMSAGAAFFWFLVVHRILGWFTASAVVRRVGAGAAVALSGTAFTVWNQSNVNEKVYTVTLFTIALISWIAFLWRDHVEEHRGQTPNRRWHDDNAILLVIFILALSVGNHLMAFLVAPALFVFLVLVKPRALGNWRLYPLAAAFAVLGLSVQLALPIRANLDPVINEASPQCRHAASAFTAVITMGQVEGECPMLGASLRRDQYAKPSFIEERMAGWGVQMANFFQYFDWQWSRSLDGRRGYYSWSRLPFTLLFLALGFAGAWAHYRRDRKSFWYIAVLYLTLSVGLVYYMNFRPGYMQAQMAGYDDSEVRERDYFYLITFSVWGLWAGIGLVHTWLEVARSLGSLDRRSLRRASPVMAVALIPLVTNWSYATRAGDYAARDFAYNLLQSVEPYGVLVTNGDNDTFPLWYLQEVEGIRRDVTVIVMSYFNTPWYAQQLRDLTRPCPTPGAWAEDRTRILCQRPFEPAGAPSFRAAAPAPTRSILPFSDAEIEYAASAGGMRAPPGLAYEARGHAFEIPSGTAIYPAHHFVILMLQNTWGDRPIYFAATTNTHMELGLTQATTRQGLAYKLLTVEEAESAGEALQEIPPEPGILQFTGGWYDLELNRRLVDEVFQWRNMPDRRVWADDATRNIPMQYFYAFASMATVAQLRGDAEAADAYTARAQGFQALARER